MIEAETMPATPKPREAGLNTEIMASLAAELEAAQDQVSSLQRELANRELDIGAYEARIGAVEAEAARRVTACEQQAQQRTEAAEQRILDIYRSWSWRLTGPFRRIMRLTKRLSGGG